MAANPPFVCPAQIGCRMEPGPTHDIGRGATVTLPEGWTYYAYPEAPLPEMAGLREIRAFKGPVVVAISPIPNIDGRRISEQWIREVQTQASAEYVAQSKEQAVRLVPFSRVNLVGSHVSFTASEGTDRPFTVLPDRRYACVTSFLVAYRSVLFSISVASEEAPDEDYRAAVSAIRALR